MIHEVKTRVLSRLQGTPEKVEADHMGQHGWSLWFGTLRKANLHNDMMLDPREPKIYAYRRGVVVGEFDIKTRSGWTDF